MAEQITLILDGSNVPDDLADLVGGTVKVHGRASRMIVALLDEALHHHIGGEGAVEELDGEIEVVEAHPTAR